jgi:hypothetical protein
MRHSDRGDLSEKEKIDRAARHEEVRFLKRQQWAVTTAGAALLGAFLAVIRNGSGHMVSGWGKYFAIVPIVVLVWAGWYFLNKLQDGLGAVRLQLDPCDPNPFTRGDDILRLHKFVLLISAVVVGVAIFCH